MKKNQEIENFWEKIPERNLEWDRDEDGKVYLIKEKTKKQWLKKVIEWVNKRQDFYIHLDERGSAVWLAIDGQRNNHEILHQVREEFGEELQQAEGRVALFLNTLKQNNFITYP